MGVEEMSPTVRHSHAESSSVAPENTMEAWEAGKAERGEVERLLGQIRQDMAKSSNQRRSLKASRREAARAAMRVPPPDPTAWRKELDALRARGLTDINLGFWRVSTVQQTADEGPERQIDAIVAHSIALAPRGVDLWAYDVDSGKEESRVGLDFVMEAMASGCVASVTVERLDRIARNQWLAETVNREAFRSRVQVRSATEHIPAGAVGDLLRQILQAISQYELALIKSRLSGSKKAKRQREGTANGGETPYGYLAAGEGYYAVCEPEARIVRLVHMLYSQGYNQSAIANALNRWGVPTRLGGRLGWRQGQIRRMLVNEPAYRAEALFTKTIVEYAKVAHEPLLSRREDPAERTYLFGNVATRLRHQVPDDLVLQAPAPLRVPNSHHSLSTEQATTLRTMFALRDRGTTIAAVAAELNRLGMRSLTGREWRNSNVQAHLTRRELYEAAIERAGVTEADVRGYLDAAAHEAACVERIRELRAEGMSYPSIRERMTEEGLRTASGAEWSVSSLYRVCSGRTRQAVSRHNDLADAETQKPT